MPALYAKGLLTCWSAQHKKDGAKALSQSDTTSSHSSGQVPQDLEDDGNANDDKVVDDDGGISDCASDGEGVDFFKLDD